MIYTAPDGTLADLLERCPPQHIYWLAPPQSSALDVLPSPQDTLAAGESLQLEDSMLLRSAGRTAGGAAVLVEWRGLTVAVPNGLPPGQLPAAQVLALAQPDRAVDPAAWQAQWILVDGDGPAHWTKLKQWLHLTADSGQMWIEGK